MNRFSLAEFKDFCDKNNIEEYRLESAGFSDVMGSVCKVSLLFSSVLIAEEFDIITLKNDNSSASLMCIREITMTKSDDNLSVFTIVCGIENEYKAFELYIKINEKNDCICNICNNKFNMYDMYNGLKIKKTLGYGSKYDGDDVNINICIKCLDEILSNNKM